MIQCLTMQVTYNTVCITVFIVHTAVLIDNNALMHLVLAVGK